MRKLLQECADEQYDDMLGDVRIMLDVLARNLSNEDYPMVLLLVRASRVGSNPPARGGVALLGTDMRRHDLSRRGCHRT